MTDITHNPPKEFFMVNKKKMKTVQIVVEGPTFCTSTFGTYYCTRALGKTKAEAVQIKRVELESAHRITKACLEEEQENLKAIEEALANLNNLEV